MEPHPLLHAFQNKKPAFGTWLTSGGFFHARVVAQASPKLTWVMIDCEHGLVSLNPGAAELIAAIHGVKDGPSALVRIAATGNSSGVNWQIKYALDAGARGVLVPWCQLQKKQEKLFGIAGIRLLEDEALYFKEANRNVLVLVQIETVDGVQNAKEIAEVEGIDGLFIGPSDLSITLGYEPPAPDPVPEVETVIQEILEISHKAGKKCAIFCVSGLQASKRAAQGFDMINVTSDVGALTEGIALHLAAAGA